MEAMPQRLYPIGIQTFSELRNKNYLYIDKTEYVYRMTHSAAKYMFLSRPRRFGKSLLTSTLHSYFSGRKELFEGLAIERLEKEWIQYPVLHFDMSTAKHADREQLIYGRDVNHINVNQRMEGLIRHACEQTGRQTVVLIDEYDAPLLDVVHEKKNLPALRSVMQNFYSPLKASDPYLRYVFLTGITKFSQLSIFSELNNIKNISMDEPYSAICGITEEEMLTQMSDDLDLLAQKMKVPRNEAIAKLKDNYDGYHFAWPSPDIYNPFSLLNAFADGKINSYWFSSGTPTYLIEMLNRFSVVPSKIGSVEAVSAEFDAPTEHTTSITPLLYQSGYITLTRDDMDGALRLLQEFLSTVPYCDNANSEGHYQQVFYIIFSLLGYYIDVEVHTPRGRVDIVMRTRTTLYVMELKLDQTAGSALQQIDLKNYPERFALCGLPVVKVGINFDSKRKTLENWKIEKV